MSKLLDIAEVANLLGVDTKTLRRWDNSGKLKAIRTFGNHRRYKSEDIDALINNEAIQHIEHKKKLEANEEMVQDLVSVVTCFSAKIYGARGGKKIKQTLEELEKERRSEDIENNSKSNVD